MKIQTKYINFNKYQAYKFSSETFQSILDKPNNDFNNLSKRDTNRIIKVTALSLFIISNPTSSFALDLVLNKSKGFAIVNELSEIIIYSTITVTAIRLFLEYIQGANTYRISDILKECILVIVLMILLPKLPILFDFFLK